MTAPPYPHLRVDLGAVEHNAALMAAWAASHGAALTPHVKTTMSPEIVRLQVEAGAERLTVATVGQARTVLSWGYTSLLVANEVVDVLALRQLRNWLESDLDIACFVDSPEGVALAQEVFAMSTRPLPVLAEVGVRGGRTGVRDKRSAHSLARLVHSSPGLRLIGVAGYEGVVPNSRDGATTRAVREHCRRTAETFTELAQLCETPAPVLSMGGSAFPDIVVAETTGLVPDGVLALRSGCYVTHDHGTYAAVSPLTGLKPAITVRAQVISAPEPGVVVLGAGKRELPHDAGLPVLLGAQSVTGAATAVTGGRVTTLYDHHAVVTGAPGLRVADVAELGISHPCSAFGRWDSFLLTRDGRVTGTGYSYARPSHHVGDG
ncbi:alanine racemase [Amycolatopsis sp. cmx-4-61]|uniref:alanine racemase n=1 Tax=Amycolatopsis sp. cmx-4-61 TaxID=2790937 RepID=UPI003979BFD3